MATKRPIRERDEFRHQQARPPCDGVPQGACAGGRGAIFTDGLQHLVLDYATRAPFEQFFHPTLLPLRMARTDDGDALSFLLHDFLGSPRVNQRTDDDKTLILGLQATLLAALPRPSTDLITRT